jgi:hypothetical protein
MVFIVSPVSTMGVSFIQLNFILSIENAENISKLIMAFSVLLLGSFILAFYFIQCLFFSFTLNEIVTAGEIIEGIEEIGNNKKVYGLETE